MHTTLSQGSRAMSPHHSLRGAQFPLLAPPSCWKCGCSCFVCVHAALYHPYVAEKSHHKFTHTDPYFFVPCPVTAVAGSLQCEGCSVRSIQKLSCQRMTFGIIKIGFDCCSLLTSLSPHVTNSHGAFILLFKLTHLFNFLVRLRATWVPQ